MLLLTARYPLYTFQQLRKRVLSTLSVFVLKNMLREHIVLEISLRLSREPHDVDFASCNPLEALNLAEKLTPETAAVFVLKDYVNFFN